MDPVLEPVPDRFCKENMVFWEGPRALWCFTGSSFRDFIDFCTEPSKKRFGDRPGTRKWNHFRTKNFKNFASGLPGAILDRPKSGRKAFRRGSKNGPQNGTLKKPSKIDFKTVLKDFRGFGTSGWRHAGSPGRILEG